MKRMQVTMDALNGLTTNRSLSASVFTALLCFLGGCGFFVFTPEETPPDAGETARRLVTCLHLGSIDEAHSLMAFDQADSTEAARTGRVFLRKYSDRITSGRRNLAVVEVKTSGRAAVAILRQRDLQPNPKTDWVRMYLLKTKDGWKISPDWSSYQPLVSQNPAMENNWPKLAQWSGERIETLKRSSAESG